MPTWLIMAVGRHLALVVLAPVAVLAAGKIEDHSASWAAAGLSVALVAIYSDALPPKLLPEPSQNTPRLLLGPSQAPLKRL